MRLVKFEDRYAGWLGEGCMRPLGRRFIKRLEHRHNRHAARAAIRSQL